MSISAHIAEHFETPAQQWEAANLGMWVFLATEILFFAPLFLGYLYGRTHEPQAFAQASHHTNILLGTTNTAVLLTSSLTMALAVRAASAGAQRALRNLLIATTALGALFVGIKAWEWVMDWHEQLVPGLHFNYHGVFAHGVEFFFFLYFIMTGLHAVHLSIGIVVILVLTKRAARGRYNAAYHTPVEVAGLYWHFVDVIWIFLYPLLYLVERYR